MTIGAAGSAIKGISVVPVNPPESVGSINSAEIHISPGVENHPAAEDRMVRPSIALSVFTIARDQRLSRWDLVEDNTSVTCTSVRETDGPYSSESRTRADGADSSSTPGLENGGDSGGRRCDVGDTACQHEQTATSRHGSDELGQRARQDKVEERRRWRLRWRAGCVTDVADVSGLDVYPLPVGNTAQGASTNEGAVNEARVSPAALVAVSGQGLQLVLFDAY